MKSTNPHRSRKFVKCLLALIILAGAGFGYAMVHFKESPVQVWQRLVDFVETMAKPEPTSEPEPTPPPPSEVTVEPAPAPMPEAVPEVTSVDPLAWLLTHKQHAPRQLTLQRPATFSIALDGKTVGSETLPAGTTLQLVGFTAEAVDVRSANGTGQLPIDATNLRTLAKSARTRAEQAKATQAKTEQAKTEQAKTEQAKAAPLPSALSPASQQTAPTVGAVEFPTPRYTSPGVIFNREDLDTIKANLRREPWKSGFEALASDRYSRERMYGPCKEVTRAPHLNIWPWRRDMMSIWNRSLMWYFTGDDAHAQKARDILLAWATTHTSFGGRESMLDIGDYAFCFVGGADILRGTWPGWTEADTAAVKKYFNDVLIPASNPYGESQFGAANKGALALCAKGLMAIFNEDTAMLKTVVYQTRTLAHIGLRSSNEIGMLGDSLRDQGHAHGQLLSLALLAEALWKQGIDIYSDYDNRLLTAGEYFARVNELVPTPFLPFGTTDNYYIGDWTNRGWEHGNLALNLIHGAYAVRKGLPTPYTDRRLETMPVDKNSFMFIKQVDDSEATPVLPPAIPTTTPITSGFSNTEIGGARPSGGATYADGIWTVQGGGNEMWGTNDSGHFTYKAISGDCAIIAKVESVEDTGPAKAGVMMRTSLSEGAPRAWMAVTPKTQFEQNIQGLAVYGGTNYSNKVYDIPSSSYWVKLERIGNIVTGYVSPDGTNWAATDVGRFRGTPPETLYVGLVVCSVNNGTLNTSTFSNVQITGGDGGAPVVAPDAPAALLASPLENAVRLRWQSSFGATSYTVKRAPHSDGPYTTVASGITTNHYTDTTVRNRITYHYVVSAVNSAGESPNSPEDSVAPGVPK